MSPVLKPSINDFDGHVARFKDSLRGRKFEKWTEIYDQVKDISVRILDVLKTKTNDEIHQEFPELNDELLQTLIKHDSEGFLRKISEMSFYMYEWEDYKYEFEAAINELSSLINSYSSKIWVANIPEFQQLTQLEKEMRFSLWFYWVWEVNEDMAFDSLQKYGALSKNKNFSYDDIPMLELYARRLWELLNGMIFKWIGNIWDDFIQEWFDIKRYYLEKVRELESEVYLGDVKTTKYGTHGIKFDGFRITKASTVDGFCDYDGKVTQYMDCKIICCIDNQKDLWTLNIKKVLQQSKTWLDTIWRWERVRNSKNMSELSKKNSFWELENWEFAIHLQAFSKWDSISFQSRDFEFLISDFHNLTESDIKNAIWTVINNLISHGTWKELKTK